MYFFNQKIELMIQMKFCIFLWLILLLLLLLLPPPLLLLLEVPYDVCKIMIKQAQGVLTL